MDTFYNLREILASSVAEFIQTLTAYLPNLITALLLLLLSWRPGMTSARRRDKVESVCCL